MENLLSHFQYFKSDKLAGMSETSAPADSLFFQNDTEKILYKVTDGAVSTIDMDTKQVIDYSKPSTMKKRPHCCKAMLHEGKIYSFVGNSIFIYDTEEKEWQQVKSETTFPTEGAIIKRFVQETVFVFFGGLVKTMTNAMLEYRPSDHSVKVLGKHPKYQGVIGMAYAYRAFNDSLVIHGGYIVSESNHFFWQYHFPSQTWKAIPELNPYTEQYESAVMLDAHQFFVIGGLLNGNCSTGYVYDFRTQYWRWRSNIYFVAGVNMPPCTLSKKQQSVVLYVGSNMFSIRVNVLEREPLEKALWTRRNGLTDVQFVF